MSGRLRVSYKRNVSLLPLSCSDWFYRKMGALFTLALACAKVKALRLERMTTNCFLETKIIKMYLIVILSANKKSHLCIEKER